MREMPERARYIPKLCPQRFECRRSSCLQIYRIRKYICAYPYTEESFNYEVEMIKRFNKALKIIPAKDRYRLKGIRCWRTFKYDVVLGDVWKDGFTFERCLREAKRLVKAGFSLRFYDGRRGFDSS